MVFLFHPKNETKIGKKLTKNALVLSFDQLNSPPTSLEWHSRDIDYLHS